MKNVVVIILMLFSLLAFSQGENKTDGKGQKQGEWKKYHPNGMLRYVGKFKNDKPIGEFKYYYDSGKTQTKMSHSGSTTYTIMFYETGEVKVTGKYINQKRDSTWVYFDLDGYKKATEYYTDGMKDKIWYTYYSNGQVAEEKEYKNDFENGTWKQYYGNGKLKMEAIYENGGLEGKATYYNSAGKRSVSGFYYHGLRNGVWLYFEPDGNKVKKKEKYAKGRRVDANKDENIETNPLEPINEEFLKPDNFMTPR